jgi:hypothetical protein
VYGKLLGPGQFTEKTCVKLENRHGDSKPENKESAFAADCSGTRLRLLGQLQAVVQACVILFGHAFS